MENNSLEKDAQVAYKIIPLPNNKKYYQEILSAIGLLFDFMFDRHRNIFSVRFVLVYPSDPDFEYPSDNARLFKFIKALTLNCQCRNFDPKYVWVKEHSVTGQVQYHVLLLLDGDLIQNGYSLLKEAAELWENVLGIENGGGLGYSWAYCDSDDHQYAGTMIKQDDPNFEEVLNKYFVRVNDLARYYRKCDLCYVCTKEFGHSRLC